jgi:T-complex protein 1 subunit beta
LKNSVTVLCGELLREAEFLVNQRIHPMTIMAGWRSAVSIARKALVNKKIHLKTEKKTLKNI